ncbi:MAG TPA: hypothetical protein VFB14_04850 [Bryobacteraceae bacterium]|jgi:hypothetical protein|nr:hypothetical protein [Bryobacteraceae bacterium]
MFRRFALIAFIAAAANFLLATAMGGYDLRFGPVHLVATYIYKPLLYVNAAFLLVLIANAKRGALARAENAGEKFHAGMRFWAVASGLLFLLYGCSFAINSNFPDWTHRALTTGVPPWIFFVHRQYDGFYRPLVFVSLWADNQIFGPALWGYHIQNLILQLLNAYLVAHLAFRLGLNTNLARWCGIVFLVVPASFEAVIWPGARFDLMAAAFTLIALDRALSGSLWLSTAAYCLGVLSKESAYAYPLLLAALMLFAGVLGIRLERKRWLQILAAAAVATVGMLLIRVGIYGNLGGYPSQQNGTGPAVNFVLRWKTLTDFPVHLPATLLLINTGAGLSWWLRITLFAYIALLAVLAFGGASAGKRTVLLAIAIPAAAPTANMLGWMTPFAQQGRYLYQPLIWVAMVAACAIWCMHIAPRYRQLLLCGWTAVMATAALFNTSVYLREMRTIRAATTEAEAACRDAGCRRLVLENLPRDYEGTFYFGWQVRYNVTRDLPGVALATDDDPVPRAGRTVALRWTDENRWRLIQ